MPATGHKWVTLVEVSATESAEGVIIYMCSVCEATRQETIPKIEHVHDYDYVSIYGVGVACFRNMRGKRQHHSRAEFGVRRRLAYGILYER